MIGAPDVPSGFWSVDLMRDALDSWHIGRVIAAYRNHPYHGRPLSQEAIGGWVGMSQPQISKLETGPPEKHLDRLVLWARTLKIPRQNLWFGLPTDAAPDLGSDDVRLADLDDGRDVDDQQVVREGSTLVAVYDRWDAMLRRRSFLAGAGAAAATLFTNRAGLSIDSGPDLTEVLTADAALTANYWRVEGVIGPGAIFSQAVDHHQHLTTLLQRARRTRDRERIGPVVADAGILLGWLHFDLEQYDQASAVYRRTLEVADELNDVNLQAFLVGRLSRTLSECGQHHEALAFAEMGDQLAGKYVMPQIRSWLASTRAFVHASVGEESASRASLDTAVDLMARATDQPPPTYIAFYGEPNQFKWAGHSLLRLAEHKSATPREGGAAIDQAMAIWPAASVRESGEVLSALASARLAEGEVDEAARLTIRAHDVGARTGSPRILRYVTDLRQRMAPHRQTRAVRALDDHLLAGHL